MTKEMALIGVILGWCPALCASESSAVGLLRSWRTGQKALQRLAMEGESRTEVFRSEGTYPGYNRQLGELRMAGRRLDLLLNNWANLEGSARSPAKPERPAARYIWDGDRYYSINFPQYTQGKGTGFVAIQAREPEGMVSMFSGTPVVLGIFQGDRHPFVEIMEQADSLMLRKSQEQVDGSPCRVIEATTPSGKYTVWLRPDRSNGVARAVVEKGANDLYFGKAVKDAYPQTRPAGLPVNVPWEPHPQLVSVSFIVSGVKFDRVGEVWVPVEGVWEVVEKDKLGGTERSRVTFKTQSVNLNPDFARMGAFVPDVPDGTRVFVEGQDKTPYVWRRGKPVVDVDEKIVK